MAEHCISLSIYSQDIPFLSIFLIMVSSLISVAFYTIMERKMLAYIQIRKGPNKVGFLGVLQPFSDAIKLFSKSLIYSEHMNLFLSSFSPALAMIISLMLIPILPFSYSGLMDLNMSILSFFVISSISVYTIMLIGWSANSKYCYIGAIRSVAQMISYEVSLFMIILSSVMFTFTYAMQLYSFSQETMPLFFLISIPFCMWLLTCLAETNRSPFDFAEGESELVSGFNVEYMGGLFALIFLAEYLSMVILSFMSTILFFGDMTSPIMMMIVLFSSMFLWIRGTLPRFRYDILMTLNWKIFLPLSIAYFMVSFSTFFLTS